MSDVKLDERIKQLELTVKQLTGVKENGFINILDNAILPVFIHTQGIFSYLNNAALDVYGAKEPGDILGKPIETIIHPQYKDQIYRRIKQLNKGGLNSPLSQQKHVKLDGTVIDVEVSAIAFKFKFKDAIMVFVRDITQEKKHTREIETKEKFIRTVLDNLPIGIALNTIDDGKATYINRKFSEIYGWPAEDMADVDSFFEKVYPDESYRSLVKKRVISDIMSGDPERMNWKNLKVTQKDSSIRYINAVNIPLPEQNTMVSTVIDITDLKKTESDLINAKEKAEEGDRIKTAFLKNISHEIRTPMNSIMGFSDILQGGDIASDKKDQFIEIILKSSNQLLNLLKDIITISDIENIHNKIKISEVNVKDLTDKLYLKFLNNASNPGLIFSLSQSREKAPLLLTDNNMLEQILTNLLSNAFKFTERGFIDFGYTKKSNTITFFVKDSGVGIDPSLHESIFRRFNQVDLAMNRKHGGLGLGLTITKELTTALGGSIKVKSNYARGSSFYVTFPLYNKIELAAMKNTSKEKERKKILIVEDEDFNYILLKEFLSGKNADLIWARSGKEAIEICTTDMTIDLVLMDIKMPGIDGHTATYTIKEIRPQLPVIAQSAYALESEIRKYKDVFDGYVTKPINKEILLNEIATKLKL